MNQSPSFKGFQSIYSDASFFIALFSKRDSKHKRALQLFNELKDRRINIYTCWFIISEAMTILLYHYSYSEALAFNESLDLYKIIYPEKSHYYEALSLFNRYAIDKRISFIDALSKVIISQKLNQIPAISFDRDFKTLGLTTIS